jgi:enoyl-CoA hydratase/carnithine racemase
VARTLGNCLSIENYKRLVNQLGYTAVKQNVFTAKLFDAQRAYQLGFLSEIVEPDKLMERATELSETIAGNAPLTIRATKEALRRIMHDGANADGQDLVLSCYMSQDFREGMTAFFEKRPAKWTGR